jgi:hypothetical protein
MTLPHADGGEHRLPARPPGDPLLPDPVTGLLRLAPAGPPKHSFSTFMICNATRIIPS